MRRKWVKVVLLCLGVVVAAGIGTRFQRCWMLRVAHQRPYKWDQFVVPNMRFTNEPISNVVRSVNDAVRVLSKGTVERAVLLDDTPVQITKFAPGVEIERQMNDLISAFRAHEAEMIKKGANGYETAPYTGTIVGGHSLGCQFQMLTSEAGLGYEEKEDGIHIRRDPRFFECRAYKITSGLVALMEKERQANDFIVDAEPIISAFAHATRIYSWSIMVPDGPNSGHGEYRVDKVFRHLPNLDLILALATPEEHVQAASRLKAAGLWADVVVEANK